MKSLPHILSELEEKLSYSDLINPIISATSVGWHIDHSLMVINQIIKAVNLSEPKEYEWKFNSKRLIVFTLNKIPRGKAKAPKAVIPVDEFDTDSVREKFIMARENIELLKELHPNKFFMHPFFGKLNVKHTFKMIQLHTNHHLHIIKDIISSVD